MISKYLNLFLFKIKNPSCKVHYSVRISRKVSVGQNCTIGENCAIASSVTLGDNVKIGGSAKLTNIKIGNNSMIDGGVKVVGPRKGKITIGKECYIGVNNVLDTSDDITIGDFVHIAGPSTGLWCHSSVQMCLNSIPLDAIGRDKYRPTAPIHIKDNVYIGGNCTIYPGVTLANHSVVAPNSALNKNVKANTLVGGVPAKLIKKLN